MTASFRVNRDGKRRVRYFSGILDGDFEDAFRLCACNYRSVGQGEHGRLKPEIVKVALTGGIRLAAHAMTLEIHVDPNTATLL